MHLTGRLKEFDLLMQTKWRLSRNIIILHVYIKEERLDDFGGGKLFQLLRKGCTTTKRSKLHMNKSGLRIKRIFLAITAVKCMSTVGFFLFCCVLFVCGWFLFLQQRDKKTILNGFWQAFYMSVYDVIAFVKWTVAQSIPPSAVS